MDFRHAKQLPEDLLTYGYYANADMSRDAEQLFGKEEEQRLRSLLPKKSFEFDLTVAGARQTIEGTVMKAMKDQNPDADFSGITVEAVSPSSVKFYKDGKEFAVSDSEINMNGEYIERGTDYGTRRVFWAPGLLRYPKDDQYPVLPGDSYGCSWINFYDLKTWEPFETIEKIMDGELSHDEVVAQNEQDNKYRHMLAEYRTFLYEVTDTPFEYMEDPAFEDDRQALWDYAHMDTFSEDTCMNAVQTFPYAIRYMSPEEKTPGLCMEAVERCGAALKYIEDQTPDMCIVAVQNDALALEYVKEQTPEICMAAVQGEFGRDADHNVLEYVDRRYLTEEICQAAVENNPDLKEYVGKLRENGEIQDSCQSEMDGFTAGIESISGDGGPEL